MKKGIETIKKDQWEVKNAISSINNTLEGLNSRWDEAEDWISDLEDKVEKKHLSSAAKRKEIKKNEESLRNLWDNMKRNNIRIMGIPRGEESEQGIKNLSEEIMTENFPSLVKEKDTQVRKCQESQTKWTQRGPHWDTS